MNPGVQKEICLPGLSISVREKLLNNFLLCITLDLQNAEQHSRHGSCARQAEVPFFPMQFPRKRSN